MGEIRHDSIRLVVTKGDPAGRLKSDYEKWLVYCPSIASDTLLYYIKQGESYSVRSYGGRLGVNAKGRHAEGAHTSLEFERLCRPERVREMSHMELAVTRTDRWQRVIAERWVEYQAAQSRKPVD